MFSDEYLYAIALRKCTFIGDIVFKKLIDAEGSAENVWRLPKKALTKIFGIGNKITSEIGSEEHLKFAEKELNFCSKNNIKINLRHLSQLPALLQDCVDAPAVLYQKGNYDEGLNSVSVVGTRNITAYGKHFVEELLDALKNQNLQTVSGLALGVDAEVHQKSLDKKIKTVGVLAHGFHTFYPSKNKMLSEKILENGGVLLTEFNTSKKPDRENFIQRNRIVAGLSPVTIVVETAYGGGSMSTVSFANSYNREVYALPGKITDKYSQGCNLIVAQNKAGTISSVKDLVKELNFGRQTEHTGELFPKSEARVQLTEKQQPIFNIIKNNPLVTIDEISQTSEQPPYKILPILLEIEILGYIKSFSGRQFQAI